MRLELLAVLIGGGLTAVRLFAVLVDTHYQSALMIRRAINDARLRAEEKLRARLKTDIA